MVDYDVIQKKQVIESVFFAQVAEVSLQDSEPADATRRSTVPGEAVFKKSLEQHDLPFTFDDGLVSSICPSPEDPIWSVNIKRGILSAFQNTMPRFDLDYQRMDVSYSYSITAKGICNFYVT